MFDGCLIKSIDIKIQNANAYVILAPKNKKKAIYTSDHEHNFYTNTTFICTILCFVVLILIVSFEESLFRISRTVGEHHDDIVEEKRSHAHPSCLEL